MALDVNRKECFLHDILRVDAALHPSAGEAAHEAGRMPKEFAIGAFVSRDCGAEQPGEIVFVPTVQADPPPQLRPCTAPCYVAGKILFNQRNCRSRNRVAGRM
jgi:hypothetical protein